MTNRRLEREDPRLHYWGKGNGVQNFGDYLGKYYLRSILTSPKIEADVFHFVGSVIDEYSIERDLKRVVGSLDGVVAYWGCGARTSRPVPERFLSRGIFCGIRGPLSRDVLGLPPDTPLGDTGLLLPLVHAARPSQATGGRTICIPHILDTRPKSELLALAGTDLLLNPTTDGTDEDLHRIIDDIVSADFVLTASLHGAIVAFAYGRPFAFWDNGHLDLPFKWQDFAASVGIPASFVKTLAEGQEVFGRDIAPNCKPLPLAPILAASPYSVKSSVMARALLADGAVGTASDLAIIAAFEAAEASAEAADLALHATSLRLQDARNTLSAVLKRDARLSYLSGRKVVSRLLKSRF